MREYAGETDTLGMPACIAASINMACSTLFSDRIMTGREAKFYRLTRKGRAQLDTEAASWQRLTQAVGLILGMAEGGAE